MKTLFALSLLVIGTQIAALAALGTPEIDPASGASAIAMLAGAIVVIRGRRKR